MAAHEGRVSSLASATRARRLALPDGSGHGERRSGSADTSRQPTEPMVIHSDKWRDRLAAAGLFVAMFAVYNANGREVGSFDTQSTKFAARELLLRRTLILNHVVGATPQYAERWGFIHAADGNYRTRSTRRCRR